MLLLGGRCFRCFLLNSSPHFRFCELLNRGPTLKGNHLFRGLLIWSKRGIFHISIFKRAKRRNPKCMCLVSVVIVGVCVLLEFRMLNAVEWQRLEEPGWQPSLLFLESEKKKGWCRRRGWYAGKARAVSNGF